MSLNRMALRTAAVLALTNYYQEPWPTMAAARVFDSRIDPITGAEKSELVPTISVYTDADTGDDLSSNNGGPPFRRVINLNLWLTLGMVGEDTELGEPTIIFPQTDTELEASLDLFEHQTRFAFMNFQNQWTRLLLGFWTRMTAWKSDRLAAEANVRLAARQITATIEIKDDDWPEVASATPAVMPLPAHVQALLNAVESAGPPRGSVASTIELMRGAQIPHTIVADQLRRIRLRHSHPN
ncbi:MAG: hypothetical protein FJ143_17050, partial [Deltaproteobacteria bacterium]|nr:hypothetical protein [Deltaproteobacteria bacterium]